METVELGEMMAMILNLGENGGNFGEILAGTVDSLQKFIRDHFGFSVAVLAGEAHQGLPEYMSPGWRPKRRRNSFIRWMRIYQLWGNPQQHREKILLFSGTGG